MAAQYQQFGKKQFYITLIDIAKKNGLGYFKEVSDELAQEDASIWELVYRFPSKDKNVDILVYSSIDKRTGFVRDCGDDCVRLVYRMKVEDGFRYRKIKKHLRIKTLFKNLEQTLVEATQQVIFNEKEFSRAV